MATVLIENVSKVFPDGFRAVDNANLEVRDREFVVLVGPSGCGKSTMLRMVAGLEEISSGHIYIDGRRVNDVPPKDRDIAMVFQNYALYPHMTVHKNMAFGLMLRKHPKAEIDQRVREAAQILGITDEQLQRKPKALSGGQRQRVAVGRAIVRKPKAFLFDEPLSNLDAKMRVQMRAEISKLHDRLQSTMIYVTHDQVEAMTMGDRIVVMKDGVIQQVAEPIELYDNPKNLFVAGFIGSPPMNFIRGNLQTRNGALWFVERATGATADGFAICIADPVATKLLSSAGQPIVLGVRPEAITDLRHTPQAHPEQTFPATVEVVEPLGSEIYLYLSTGQHNVIARIDPHEKAMVNQSVVMATNPNKVHFFDPQTERAIA